MKRLLLALLSSILIMPTYAATTPFTGTRYFEFGFGAALTITGSISIQKNGNTIIRTESCGHMQTGGTCSKEIEYKGKYKKTMNSYKILSNNKIAILDDLGRIDDTCTLGKCVSELSKTKY